MNRSHRWIQTYNYKAEAERAQENFIGQGEEVTDIEYVEDAGVYAFYVTSMFARFESPTTA